MKTPKHQLLGDTILQAIVKNKVKPAEVLVADESMIALLSPLAREAGFVLKKARNLKTVSRVHKDMERHMLRKNG